MTTIVGVALGIALLGALALLHVFGLYAVAIFVLGALVRRSRATPISGRADAARFATLVVAHDEERVIADSVRSLVGQDYPRSCFEVYVIADHCTDRTAAVARRAGATVLERVTGHAEGKSAALAFGLEAVAREARFDAIAVFDADNRPVPAFLAKMGERLGGGERVVQGLIDAKNPGASWVSGASALGFWAIAALAQAPRERLGLSAPLMGTGFAMRLDDALRLLLGPRSLADDLDLGARLAVAGVRVAYEPGARTEDEKPVLLETAVAQRHRWMQGRWVVAAEHLPKLVARTFGPAKDGAPLGVRLRALDVAIQLVAPSLLFTGVAAFFLTTLVVLLGHGPRQLSAIAAWIPPGWSLGAAAAYYVIPALGIARFRPPGKVWLCYLSQPLYLAFSAPLAVSGWLRRGDRHWKRTPKGADPPGSGTDLPP